MSTIPILYLHGFASSPRGRKIEALRAILHPAGIVLHTPDMNVPSFEHLDYDAMVAHAVDAALELQPRAIVGSSLGALVALEVVRRGAAKPLVLIAPAVGVADRWTILIPKGDPVMVYNFARETRVPIHRAFFDRAETICPEKEPPPTRVTLIMGRHDESVPYERVEGVWRNWVSSGNLVPGSRFVEIPDGDHGLVAFAGLIAEEIEAIVQ